MESLRAVAQQLGQQGVMVPSMGKAERGRLDEAKGRALPPPGGCGRTHGRHPGEPTSTRAQRARARESSLGSCSAGRRAPAAAAAHPVPLASQLKVF